MRYEEGVKMANDSTRLCTVVINVLLFLYFVVV
jgi:hypothetical protein